MCGQDKPVLGVGAIVIHDDKILLVKRGNPPCKGCWAIPGGHVEYGESIYDAVLRELFEETNICGEPLGVIYVDEILPEESGENYHFVLIDILVKPKRISALKPGSDALDAKFYPINNPPESLTPSTRRLLKYLKQLIKTNKLYDKLIPVVK
jgi:8-oxo-dGTP diphosphatase